MGIIVGYHCNDIYAFVLQFVIIPDVAREVLLGTSGSEGSF